MPQTQVNKLKQHAACLIGEDWCVGVHIHINKAKRIVFGTQSPTNRPVHCGNVISDREETNKAPPTGLGEVSTFGCAYPVKRRV